MEILPAIVLYVEVFLLALVEKQVWKTLYTPLNCLMIPYAFILGICLLVDGNMGFVPFYYPSIWVWVVGIAVFFIPSFFLGIVYSAATQYTHFKTFSIPFHTVRILEKITRFIIVLFVLKIAYMLLTCPFSPGSENFGRQLAGEGFFGHLFTCFMVLFIIWVLLVDKNHKRYWIYLLAFLLVDLLYAVKGWLLLPFCGSLLLRLLTGRMRMKIKLMIGVALAGFLFFFAIYWIGFMSRSETIRTQYGMTPAEYRKDVAGYIQKHFVTYLTAGVYGLSEDMAQGIEERQPEKIYTPFVNIARFLHIAKTTENGQELGMEDALNKHYLITTRLDNGTNVRTFMGTLYVFLGEWHAAVYVFLFSCFTCMVFFIARQRGNLFLLAFLGWLYGMLSLGWFDPYVQTLTALTVPVFLLLLYEICWLAEFTGKKRLRYYNQRLYR